MTKKRTSILAFIPLLILFGPLNAQQTGEIRRKITKEGGEALPGVSIAAASPSLQFRGEGDAGNIWLIDGLSERGGVFFDPGVQVNYDAWEEVQIISDGFTPEMGQALGGFINIVTKSGGNVLHGELGGGLL